MKKNFFGIILFLALWMAFNISLKASADIETPHTISWGHFEIQVDYDPALPGDEADKWQTTVSYSTTNEFNSGQGIVRLPADDVVFIFTEDSKITLPNNPADWGSLAGQSVYTIPRSQNPAEIYLGIRTTMPGGIFQIEFTPGFPFPSDSGTINLSLIDASGTGIDRGGNVVLYTFDQHSSAPRFKYDTRDGLDSTDAVRMIPVASHTHDGWAFTRPGHYKLTFAPSGVLNPDYGGQPTSGQQALNFLVPHSSVVAEVFSPNLVLGINGSSLKLATHDQLNSVIYPADRVFHQITPTSRITLSSSHLASGLGVLGASGENIWLTTTDSYDIKVGSDEEVLDRAGLTLDSVTSLFTTSTANLSNLSIELTKVEAPGRFVLLKQEEDNYLPLVQGIGETVTTSGALLSPADLENVRFGFSETGTYRIGLKISANVAGHSEPLTTEALLVFGVETLPTQSYEEWASNYETIGDLPDGSLADGTEDYDRDGIPNMYEYLFFWHGHSPLNSDAKYFPQPQRQGDSLVYHYIRDHYRNPLTETRLKTLFQVAKELTATWQTFDLNRPVRPLESHENTKITGNAVGLIQEKYFAVPLEDNDQPFLRFRTIR